jgi:hypothetical protein
VRTGVEQGRQVMSIERQELAMETLGMSLAEARRCSKAFRTL